MVSTRRVKKPALILRMVWGWGWHPGRAMSEILEWIEVLAVAGLLAFLIMTFVTVRMHVPTGSMIPAIDPSDSFFVDRISYVFRDPKPGDIVVFWHTDSVHVERIEPGSAAATAGLGEGDRAIRLNRESIFSSADADRILAETPTGTRLYLVTTGAGMVELGTKSAGMTTMADLGLELRDRRIRYVKRLIAVGGQTVEIRDGSVYVDGEKLTGERFDRTYVANDAQMSYGVSPTLVPEGHWFVLGDNTRNSLDSRYWGFVDVRDFIGEPYFRVWPFSRFGPMNGYFGS